MSWLPLIVRADIFDFDVDPRQAISTSNDCDLDQANGVVSALGPFSKNAGDCSERLSTMAEQVGKAKKAAELAHKFASNTNKINSALGTLDTLNDKLAPIIKSIPKVGGIINKIISSLDKIKSAVDEIGEKEPELKKLKEELANAEAVLEEFDATAKSSEVFANDTKAVIQSAIEHSKKNECSSSEIIDNVAAVVPTTSIEAASNVYLTCASARTMPEITAELPESELLNELAGVIGNITDWIEGVVADATAAADYGSCCYPAQQFAAIILESFIDTIELATCWANPIIDAGVEAAVGGRLKLLLLAFDPLVREYNANIGNVDAFIVSLNEVLDSLQVPVIQMRPQIEFNNGQFIAIGDFSVLISDATSSVGVVPTFTPIDFESTQVVDFESIGDELASIGDALARSCSDAAEAVVTDEAGVECCSLARAALGIPVEGKPAGDSCLVKPDCASNFCIGQECADGTEGSTCNLLLDNCNDGQFCEGTFPAECMEKKPVGGTCGLGTACQSGICIGDHCADGSLGSTCNIANLATCNGGLYCGGAFPATCHLKKEDRGSCGSHATCKSNNCIGGECSSGRGGQTCHLTNGGFCDSNLCRGALPARCAECNPPSSAGCSSSEFCHMGQCTRKQDSGTACVESRVCMSGSCWWWSCW